MTINNHKDNSDDSASLARQRGHFTVAASPLNAVKLDLAIIIVVAVIVILLVTNLVESQLEQFVWLISYGLLSMLWLVIRVRQVVQSCQGQGEQDRHET
jgi:uncharacterized membrane protein